MRGDFSAFFQKKEGNTQQCRIRVLQPEMAQGDPAAFSDFFGNGGIPVPCPREKREAAEALLIGPHGLLSAQSTGRPTPEAPCEMRTCFQRDVDRITHSKSFRRLKHKTQVFLRPEGDHYRTRLTRAHDRPRARAQRGSHRGHQPRARPRPHALRPRRRARAQRDLHRRRLPALRAEPARRRPYRARRTRSEPLQRDAHRHPQPHDRPAARHARGRHRAPGRPRGLHQPRP